ncbi:MAG: hypothetical protein ACPLRN_00580 [Microgenomates group bacterium]
MKLLAEDIKDLFGTVEPPAGMNFGKDDPVQGFASLVGFGINIFLVIAGMFLLLYLLWGAFDWINSGGEKEKIVKAQNKITNALIGIVLVFAVLVVFQLVAGNILGLIKPTDQGWQFNIPTLR